MYTEKAGDKVTAELKTNNESINVDPYFCAIKPVAENPTQIVARILREISRSVYFFVKEENDKFNGSVYPVKYRPSSI